MPWSTALLVIVVGACQHCPCHHDCVLQRLAEGGLQHTALFVKNVRLLACSPLALNKVLQKLDVRRQGRITLTDFLEYAAQKLAQERTATFEDMYRSEQGDLIRQQVKAHAN